MKGHESCPNFGNSEAPMIERMKTMSTSEKEVSLLQNSIVFVLSGELTLRFEGAVKEAIGKGQMLFIPMGLTFSYIAQANSSIIIFRLEECLQFGPGKKMGDLYDESEKEEEINRMDIANMGVCPQLEKYIDELDCTLVDGLNCCYYYELKTKELFILLRTYYTRKQLKYFFRSILSPDIMFSEFVRANSLKFKTVNDFAAALNLSPKQFINKFNQIFKQTPYQWMKHRKTQMIRSEIMDGKKSNKQISIEYGFASTSQFFDFCRDNIGKTPKEIRNAHMINKINEEVE